MCIVAIVMSENLKEALESFAEGKLVALPTETVYGLAAPIDNPDLLKKIFELKSRPFFDPLIIHAAEISQLKPLVREWSEVCDVLAQAFWPGPMTLVLEKTELVNDLITAGLSTVAIRIPDSKLGLEFLRQINVPVAAPSANLFKRVSPTKAEHVASEFSGEDVTILDGGECEAGIESVILEITKDKRIRILRPGVLSPGEIQRIVDRLGYQVCSVTNYSDSSNPKSDFNADSNHKQVPANDTSEQDRQAILAPGQLKEHYRPSKPLYTFYCDSEAEAQSTFENHLANETAIWLSLSIDPLLAARELYSQLRMSAQKEGSVLCLRLPRSCFQEEVWNGIKDRLGRASTRVFV